jgi:hypothetical protein
MITSMLPLKKYNFLLILLMVYLPSIGQKKQVRALDINTKNNSKVKTFYTNQPRKALDDKTTFYWTIKREIHSSQGGYSGNLLHGPYTEYFANNQLQVKGQLKLGIRVNEWKYWYLNGILNKVVFYKNGKIHGRVIQYNEEGKTIRIEKFKNGQRHGNFTKIINDTLSFTEKYKNGKLQTSKRKVSKPTLKIKNAPKEKSKPTKKNQDNSTRKFTFPKFWKKKIKDES